MKLSLAMTVSIECIHASHHLRIVITVLWYIGKCFINSQSQSQSFNNNNEYEISKEIKNINKEKTSELNIINNTTNINILHNQFQQNNIQQQYTQPNYTHKAHQIITQSTDWIRSYDEIK